MAESIREMVVKMSLEAGGFRKVADDIKRQIGLVNSELKGMGGDSDSAGNKVKLLGEKLGMQKKAVENYATAVEQARKNLTNASTEADKLAKARDLSRLETDLTNAQSAAKNTANELDGLNALKFTQFGNSLKTMGTQVKNFGRGISMYISAPLAALGIGSYNSFREFESAFAGVRKTVDASEDEFAALEEGLLDMSETMPTSASDLARIMETAGQLGVPTQNLLAFTKTMAMLGESTNIDATGGASDLARFMNITKTGYGDVSKLGAVLVALGNNFATTESEILAMSTRMASAGTLTGFSATEIMGLAAAMSSMGIEADAGGTAAGKLMKEMQLAAETGGEAADMFGKVMGTDATGFAAGFKTNAAQSMLDFFTGLANIDATGASSVVATLDEMGITEVRMSNMVATGATNVELYKNATKMAAEAYSDGTALITEANKRYATTASQDAMMYNKIQNASADIGENIAEAVEPAKKALDGLLESFNGLSEVEQSRIVGLAGALIVLGPAVTIIGKSMEVFGSASKGIGMLIQNKDNIIGALSGIAASPIFQVVAAGAAIYALASFLDSIPTNAESILNSLSNIQINIDKDSKDATLAAIAEVKAAADALSGEKAAQYAGTSAAVAAGYGTDTMFGQALEYERQKAEKQVGDISAMYGTQIDDLNTQIGAAVKAGDTALAESLAGQRDATQFEWDTTVRMARTAYTDSVAALINGMMLAQPEMKAKLEEASREYDLLAMMEQALDSNSDEMGQAAWDALQRNIVAGMSELGRGGEFNFEDNYSGALLSAREVLMASLAGKLGQVNEGGLAYTLINTLLSDKGATDLLDFSQLQGAFDGAVETLDFKQAVDKAKQSGNIDQFGKYLTGGLAEGVTSSAGTVAATMTTIRDATIKALMAAFAMQSPSRLMAAHGVNIPAGLAAGINTGAAMAYGAMAAMQANLVSQAASMAQMISSAFASNLNLQVKYGTGDKSTQAIVDEMSAMQRRERYARGHS